MFSAADAPDPDLVYANDLRTCAILGSLPVSRESALGLIGEWTELLSGPASPSGLMGR